LKADLHLSAKNLQENLNSSFVDGLTWHSDDIHD
jgi:hypothetical protein